MHLNYNLALQDWDKPENIPDPDAKKPEDWDEDMDGEWEPPMIPNPEYKVRHQTIKELIPRRMKISRNAWERIKLNVGFQS